MKIAFVFNRLRISPGDGVVSQALTWKKILESRGNIVDLVNVWQYFDFAVYDIVQIFGYNSILYQDVKGILMKNKNVVIAPIIDPYKPLWYDWTLSHLGLRRPVLTSGHHSLRLVKNEVKACLVRSEFEKDRIQKVYGYSSEKCHIVPLSNGVSPFQSTSPRENFCLHISRIGDPGKNVKNLIEASEKYKFKLVICGVLRSEAAKRNFDSWTRDKHYVEYRGYVSEEEKKELCLKARVFALPSFIEGVGLSALEAATWGCDIVITNIGGPKEYYSNLAKVVNPHSVDEIGEAVKYFLNGNTFQPKLVNHIMTNYSDEVIAKRLENVYQSILNG